MLRLTDRLGRQPAKQPPSLQVALQSKSQDSHPGEKTRMFRAAKQKFMEPRSSYFLIHTGLEPVTLALLAPRSNQLS